MNYQLDAHGEMLLAEFRERLPQFQRLEQLAVEQVTQALQQQGIYVTAIEHRIKTEESLSGKLELKGSKYHQLDDITDVFGIRIITFYTDDVDKVAAIVKRLFTVDWKESVDKRKLHHLNSFGYNSLHYICSLPKTLIDDPEEPALNTIRFEVQMRTALQHVWSTIEHDTGYKSDVQILPEYRRQFSRLAGMLELIDDEFSRLRNSLTDYRRRMQTLVTTGKLDEVHLSINNFRTFLRTNPFDRLNERIASVNQAEIFPALLMPFLPVLQSLGLQTLGDVQQFIKENSDDAYQLAVSGLALTDIDIISKSIGLQNLCFVYVLKHGGGRDEIKRIYDTLNGVEDSHLMLADTVIEQAASLPFMQDRAQNT